MIGIRYKKIIHKLASNRGYTLIEMMVAVTIFSMVMFGGAQTYQSIIMAQRNILASQNIQDNLRFAKELITKELRNAKASSYECAVGTYASAVPKNDADNIYTGVASPTMHIIHGGQGDSVNLSSLADILVFKNKFGECVRYHLRGGMIFVDRGNGRASSTLPITSPGITVNSLKFYVHDHGGNIFPSVTFSMNAEVPGRSHNHVDNIIVQSTVSTRNYDKFIN